MYLDDDEKLHTRALRFCKKVGCDSAISLPLTSTESSAVIIIKSEAELAILFDIRSIRQSVTVAAKHPSRTDTNVSIYYYQQEYQRGMDKLQEGMMWALNNQKQLQGPAGVNVRAFIAEMQESLHAPVSSCLSVLWQVCSSDRTNDEKIAMLDSFVYEWTSSEQHTVDLFEACACLRFVAKMVCCGEDLALHSLRLESMCDRELSERHHETTKRFLHLVSHLYAALGHPMIPVDQATIDLQVDDDIKDMLRCVALPKHKVCARIVLSEENMRDNKPWNLPPLQLPGSLQTVLMASAENVVLATPPQIFTPPIAKEDLADKSLLPAFLISAIWKLLSAPNHRCYRYLELVANARPCTSILYHPRGPHISLHVDDDARAEVENAESQTDPLTMLASTLPHPFRLYCMYADIPRVMLRKNHNLYDSGGTHVSKLPFDFSGTVQFCDDSKWVNFKKLTGLRNMLQLPQMSDDTQKYTVAADLEVRSELIYNAFHVLEGCDNADAAMAALCGLVASTKIEVKYYVRESAQKHQVNETLAASTLSTDERDAMSRRIVTLFKNCCVDNFKLLETRLKNIAHNSSPTVAQLTADVLVLADETRQYADIGKQMCGPLAIQMAALFGAEPVSWFGEY